jgi:AcrR family transcriptional regulator
MTKPTRTRLNRDRVLAAAVALADRDGLDALSMRNLADHLDVVPMALYKHVANKDELLDGVVDVIIGEFDAPDEALPWKAAVRVRILSAREVLLRHPWARLAIESRTNRTPVVLGYMDAVAGDFIRGGLSADLTHHVMHVLGNRIWGFSPELFNEAGATTSETIDLEAQQEMVRNMAEQFPNITKIVMAATDGDPSREGCDEQFEFEFALDLLLDGFERLHEAGWTSPTRDGSLV